MMMRALEAGGMPARYRGTRDELSAQAADEHYHPQHGNSLYELAPADYRQPGFPRGYDGLLIKCLRAGPAQMTPMPGGIRVVSMRRHPEEIRQSLGAFFPAVIPPPAATIEAETERNLRRIRTRHDIALLEVHYEAVLADPIGELTRIAGHFGVDLNVPAAAAVVNPAMRRFRADELVPGII